ncbi:MAG: 50S ribosomal protein L18 [Candidatus Micrarchaeales archaeon]|jgi:large subunit ribosomal protein L18|uniref:Large ribosomal subunit protein uL18 n=1 Tax=Candidatus Micrarchaeum acidiphilum ARMAN-2 TaxID=425595 RepID=C7DIU6_MICA2|nr:MAG: ribosomal protein L18P/L5E [Candidatus Micrarchaeum acidiphilum ARMAN-2]MCW6161306.1 50S ribosomal protein L18 [Candidatus Micrarchaeales archaeon]
MHKTIRRRRASALTNYAKRLALVKSRLDRLVIRKTNRGIIAQVVRYSEDGDKVLAHVNSSALRQYKWEPKCNIPTAYLTGMLLAKQSKGKVTGKLVLDNGLYRPIKSGVIFAALRGCVDGGLEVPNSVEFDESRLSGKHIAEFAKNTDKAKPGHQFSSYEKSKFDVKNIESIFNEVKKNIKT